MMKYRLLIVDDEELIRQGLSARIRSFGLEELEIDEAGSGSRALEKFASERIDIALVDISMPDMNGLELIERVRKTSPSTRFLLLSGYAEFSYAQRAIQLRVQAYLNKPVSNEVLRAHLEEALAELKGEALSGTEQQDRTVFDPEKELNILLSGELQEGRMEDACPGLSRNYPRLFDGTGKLYLAILHIGKKDDSRESLTHSRLNAIRSVVRGTFEKVPCDCERLIVNSYENPQRLCALFMDGDGQNLKQQLERVFLTMYSELERRFNVRITIGVSRMASSLNADCVSDARIALRQRFVHGRSNIYFCEDVAVMGTRAFPEADLELLRKFMEREDKAGVHRQLEQLFSEEQLENSTVAYLHVLWVRIAGMMMRVYNDMNSATINRLLSQISHMEMMNHHDVIKMLTDLIDDCLERGGGREMDTTKKIRYATNYIQEHFHEEIVINDLAAKVDMSPGYFSAVFKKEVGQSAMQYVTNLRIERAKEYLANTKLSVVMIAKSIGYADSQYFYRVFKKTTGMTPLQYRQEIQIE